MASFVQKVEGFFKDIGVQAKKIEAETPISPRRDDPGVAAQPAILDEQGAAKDLKPAGPFLSRLKDWLSYSPGSQSPQQGRILSIDALLGFDMFWYTGGEMVFVRLNEVLHWRLTAVVANQLRHVPWVGFTFYDLVHPLFLFLVGLSMPLSLERRLATSSKASLWKHIFRRVAILWFLGMIAQGNLLTYDFKQIWFYSNALQTMAAGYLVASILILYADVSIQFLVTIGMLLVYGAILALAPVPGIGRPVLEPYHNIAMYVDSIVMGSHHLPWPWTTVLPTLSFSAMVMVGVFASYIFRSAMTSLRKAEVLAVIGVVLSAAGLALSVFQPIIKHIFTPSYVVFSSGLCFLLMALSYLVIDHWKFTRWTKFFMVIESNFIFAYVLSRLYSFGDFAGVFLGGLKVHLGAWYPVLLAVGTYAVFWLILWHLYKQEIFIRV